MFHTVSNDDNRHRRGRTIACPGQGPRRIRVGCWSWPCCQGWIWERAWPWCNIMERLSIKYALYLWIGRSNILCCRCLAYEAERRRRRRGRAEMNVVVVVVVVDDEDDRPDIAGHGHGHHSYNWSPTYKRFLWKLFTPVRRCKNLPTQGGSYEGKYSHWNQY